MSEISCADMAHSEQSVSTDGVVASQVGQFLPFNVECDSEKQNVKFIQT